MNARRFVAVVLVSSMMMMMSGPGSVPADAQPAAPSAVEGPPGPGGVPAPTQTAEVTPSRLSYINGEVSFWRPGAQDWAPAKLNTPLEPGDIFYTSQSGNAEIQFRPRAFVRAARRIGLVDSTRK